MRASWLITPIIILLAGCAPKPSSPNVQVVFPEWSKIDSQSMQQQKSLLTSFSVVGVPRVTMISINASGDGVTAKVPFHWDRSSDGDVAPANASFEVPKGALIQILAILEGTGSSRFYYGEATVSRTGGDSQNLPVTISNIAASQSSVQGRVVGRYLTGPNQGPTGVFQYRFSPEKILGPGHPSMIVTTGEVFSGWMNVFGMSANLIDYTWADGTPAFVTQLGSNSLLSQVNVNPARSARITVPAGFVNDAHSDTSFKMVPQDAREVTAGFFGPYADSATGLRMCVDDIPFDDLAPKIYDLYQTTTSADSTAAPSNPIAWSSQRELASDAHILDSDVLGGTYVRGGSVSSSCATSGTPYADYLVLDGTRVAQNEDILGFRGPFAQTWNGSYFSRNYYANSLYIYWAFLPGVPTSIGGLSMFYRVLPSGVSMNDDELRSNDGYKCNTFGNPSAYAIPFQELSVPGVGIGTTQVQIMNIPDQATADRTQIVACPKAADGSFYSSALVVPTGSGDCRPTSAQLSEFEILQDTILLPTGTIAGTSKDACGSCHGETATSAGKAVYLISGTPGVNNTNTTLKNFCVAKAKGYATLYHAQDSSHGGGVYNYADIPSYYSVIGKYFAY